MEDDAYRAPRWLIGGNAQTIWPALFGKRFDGAAPAFRRVEVVAITADASTDDLARIVLASLQRGRGGRVVHAVDHTRMKMADYFDAVADAFGMHRPPRLARADLEGAVSPMLLSFMSESRQLDDTRLRRELRVRLRHPDVATTLARLRAASA